MTAMIETQALTKRFVKRLDLAEKLANRLGANSLLSASYSGMIAGDAVSAYVKGIKNGSAGAADHHYEGERKRQEDVNYALVNSDGNEFFILTSDCCGSTPSNGVIPCTSRKIPVLVDAFSIR